MIKGFEIETKPLDFSKPEMNQALQLVIRTFNARQRGKAHKVTNKKIRNALESVNIKISDIELRKIVQHIRINQLLFGLCSDSKGYWIAETPEELHDTLLSLKDRIVNQKATYDILHSQYKTMLESK